MRAIVLLAVLGALLVVSVPVASAAKVICIAGGDPGCSGHIWKPCTDPDRCEVGVIVPDADHLAFASGAHGGP